MVSCQEPSPLKGGKHSSQCHPHDAALVNEFSLCPWGWRQGVTHPTALPIAATWRGNPSYMVALAVAVSFAIAVAISDSDSIAVAVAITLAIAIAHCCCCCRGPLLRSPWTIAAAISVVLPSAIAVVVVLAIGHCHLRHHRPSQLPLPLAITVAMPLAISESCCLGAARIVFDQSKQRMLTLFYFVGTVGDVLIKAGSLTRCWAEMANTSVGQQAASSERLVRELAGGWGAAGSEGWRRWLTIGGVVLFGCWGISHWQMVDVLDVIEGIASETVIELTQEENNMRERYDSYKKCICKRESEICDTSGY
jgi:hypothetical protein